MNSRDREGLNRNRRQCFIEFERGNMFKLKKTPILLQEVKDGVHGGISG